MGGSNFVPALAVKTALAAQPHFIIGCAVISGYASSTPNRDHRYAPRQH
jgi:hypothetical protein